MNTTSKISEPTRYDVEGNESPTGLLVFYSDWDEMRQRAEQADQRAAAARDEALEEAAKECDALQAKSRGTIEAVAKRLGRAIRSRKTGAGRG